MTPRTWPDAWACLPQMVGLCRPADIGVLALLLAVRQERGDPPPAQITTPDPAYIHVAWPGVETVTINAGALFPCPATRRRRAARQDAT